MLKAALNEGTSNTANAAAAPMEGQRHGGREGKELRGNREEESSLKESVPMWRDRSTAYLPTRRKDVPGAEVSQLTN